jgi:hypothetical protein
VQLEEIKAARGLNVDDGTAAADKPLAEVLAERKKAKQDAFDEQWRQMKTGEGGRSCLQGRAEEPLSAAILPRCHRVLYTAHSTSVVLFLQAATAC